MNHIPQIIEDSPDASRLVREAGGQAALATLPCVLHLTAEEAGADELLGLLPTFAFGEYPPCGPVCIEPGEVTDPETGASLTAKPVFVFRHLARSTPGLCWLYTAKAPPPPPGCTVTIEKVYTA